MIICKKPVPLDDHLQEAGPSRWSFARGWFLWMIICKSQQQQQQTITTTTTTTTNNNNNNNDNKEGKEGEQRWRRRRKEEEEKKEEKKGGGEEGGEGKLLRMGRDGRDDIEGSIEVLVDLKSCLMGVWHSCIMERRKLILRRMQVFFSLRNRDTHTHQLSLLSCQISAKCYTDMVCFQV